MRRRDLLRTFVSGGLVLPTGCLSTSEKNPEPGSDSDDGESDDAKGEDTNGVELEPVRKTSLGNAEPVGVKGPTDRDFEFINEDEGRIRVLSDEGRSYEAEFDEWADGVCRHTGARELNGVLRERLGDVGVGGGSARVEDEMFENYKGNPDELREALGDRSNTVVVHYRTMYSREGEIAHEPDMEYERVVEETPQKLDITAVFEDHGIEHSCTYPVLVMAVELQRL